MQLVLKKETPIEDLKQPFNENTLYDLAIVGAGPAGLSAALYALRKKLNTALISKDIGGQVLQTWDLENYPGFRKISGYDLTKKMEEQVYQFPVALEEGSTVVSIEKKKHFNLCLDNGKKVHCKSAIIATGKSYKRLAVKGESEFTGKGVSYCTTCDAPLFKDKKTIVVGGGNSAIGAALELSKIAKQVYVIVRKNELRADQVLQERAKNTPNIEILFENKIFEIKGKQFVQSVALENTSNAQTSELSIDGIFIEIGRTPNTGFKTTPELKLNDMREIQINSSNETNIEGLFACGDATDIPEKQVIIAAGEGAKAALSVYKFLQK